MEYIVQETKHSKRWLNRPEYILSVEDNLSKKHNLSLLILSYNNNKQLFDLLDVISSDPLYGNFAITVVQNSDKSSTFNEFEEHIVTYKEITVIYPKENVGSAGWYALWLEYIIAEWYSHVVVIEDDILLYDKDTILSTIWHSISHPHDVIFIQPPINTWWDHSWYVQYACYPTSLLKIAWVLDPRYYFRCEDLEWRVRLEYAIKKNWYKKHIISKRYYHPYIKPGNNSWSWIYFSLRNQIWTIRKYKSLYPTFVAVLIFYITYGVLTTIRSGKKGLLMNVLLAMRDWLHKKQNLEYNKKILTDLWSLSPVTVADIWFASNDIDRTQMLYDMDTKWYISSTTLSKADKIILNKHKGNILTIWWFQPVRGAIISCFTTIYYIEYIQLDKQILSGKKLSQSYISKAINLLLFLPCALIWCILWLLYSLYLLPIQYIQKGNK